MNKKKLVAILTLLCFMFTFMPVAAMAEDGVQANNQDTLFDGNANVNASSPSALTLRSITNSWYDDNATELTIDSAAELYAFASTANNGNSFSGKKIILTTDIDLAGATWTPIKSFGGTFEGNNNTISNFQIDATENNGGFFSYISWGCVQNLTLEDITAKVGGKKRFGTLVAQTQGINLNNIAIKNVSVNTTSNDVWVGGLSAYMEVYSQHTMQNCTVEDFKVNAENGAELIGGVSCTIQKNGDDTKQTNILNNLDVKNFTVNITDDSDCGVGGVFAQTQTGWQNPRLTNCDVTNFNVTATGQVDVGGLVAYPGSHTIAENCTTQGKFDVTGVTTEECFAGGFFGDLGWNADLGQMGHKVTGCTADVDITTKVAPAGGFVGSATNSNNASMYATFTNCVAKGDITCVTGGTADIGGFAGDADRGEYNSCKAEGTVTNSGTGYAGQFIGAIYDVTPKYDGRYPAGTRDYLVDEITIEDSVYSGTSTAKFIGNQANDTDVTVKNNVAQIDSKKYETLQAAIDAAVSSDTITLLADVAEDVTVVQAENVKITIDGNGKTMNGSITVDGKSARYETADVTIKNVKFLSDKTSPDAYINLGKSGDTNTRYTNHVTVKNCDFDFNGTGDKVAIKSYTGGDKNLIVTECNVSENMHSLLQVTNVEEGLVISDCVVKSKNGVNLNNTESLTMTGCEFDVNGYAIRAGVNGSTSTDTKTFVIKNNVLSSDCNDGDAVIMLRDSAANADISMEKNAVLGVTHISGTTADTKVSADANYWNGKAAPVVKEGDTAVTVASYYEKFENGELENLIIPATDISLDKTEVTVEKGKTITLTATLKPDNTTETATWVSSDTTVATVDKGVVKGIAEGTVTITVKIANGKTVVCTVTVTKATSAPSSSSSSSGGGFSGKYNYPVNIADTIGADVTASENYATAGETVTITINPDAGKQVDEVIVTDKDGKVISVTKVGDNKYSFTMPAGKVNVSVTTENADYELRIVMQINNKNIVANNRTITNDVAPVIVGDRTLVPVRIVTELLGGTADWNEDTRTVTLKIDGKVLKLVIDQPIPGFGTSATIINDRTYVPIRYVAEKLGANVDWIAATQQIIIEK